MNYVESFNLLGVEAKEIPCIKGEGAPTSATEGAVGCFYMDTLTGKTYKCVSGESGSFVWEQESDFSEFAYKPNLFNKDDERVLANSVVEQNGSITTASSLAGYTVSHPIKVKGGKTYKAYHRLGAYGANYKCRVEDENGNFIKVVTGEKTADSGSNEGWLLFTFTEDCIVRFNVGNIPAFINAVMICEETRYPNQYIPFGEYVIKAYKVNDENPLKGKKISFNGDSICATNGGGYGKFIAENNGMTVQNVAKNGATITAETYTSDGSARHWICRTISSMSKDSDYAIVEGGVNDSSLGLPLGTFSPYSGFSADFDETTFYGAFESMLRKLTIRFAGKKIGYIAVHKMSDNFNSLKNDENSYYWAAKRCCEKWGVPFLDLNSAVPPFAYFVESGNADLYALRQTYTQSGDGWHPTDEGYKKYYVPKIEAWLKTL